jgi:hypothetical protein
VLRREIARLCLERRIIATDRIFVDTDDGRSGSVVKEYLDRSRRRIIRAIVTGIPVAVLLRISRAQASEKMTRQQAEYQDTPSGIYSCAMCTLFEKPNACKVVEGEISTDGWCKAFALLD